MKNIEIRTIQGRLAVRDDAPSEDGTSGALVISGYASVFNTPSPDMGGYREVIAPGAFTKSLAENDIRALWNHNWDDLLGRTKSGSLTLSEDDHGLAFTLDLGKTTLGKDVYEMIKRGDCDGVSFGFFIRQEKQYEQDGIQYVEIQDADLLEISPCVLPCYEETTVSARSKARLAEIERTKERKEEEKVHSQRQFILMKAKMMDWES